MSNIYLFVLLLFLYNFKYCASNQNLLNKMNCTITYNCKEVWLQSSGYNLSAWLYVPVNASQTNKLPAIIMANGYSLLKEQYMGIPAATFYEEVNVVVLLFDFRKIGRSSGEPRSEVIPSEQLDDFVNSISYARNLSYVDESSIGIWGISMTGGHVLQIGTWLGHYMGIKAVVAVVPSIRVLFTADLLFTASGVNGYFRPLMAQRRQELYESGNNFSATYSNEWGIYMSTQYFPTVSENCQDDLNCFFTLPPSYEFFMNASVYKSESCNEPSCQWMNMTTFRSVQACLEYFPMANGPITEIAVLQLAGENDGFFPPDHQRWANEQIQSPEKKLIFYREAGHYNLYPKWDNPDTASTGATLEAVNWFKKYLKNSYDYGKPLDVWPSSAGNCGTNTYFSSSSMNCQGNCPAETDCNESSKIIEGSLALLIVGAILTLMTVSVIVILFCTRAGKQYLFNYVKKSLSLLDDEILQYETSAVPPYHNDK